MKIYPDIEEHIHSLLKERDHRDILAWVQDEVMLPSPPYSISGPLDLSISRYLIEPLVALENDSVREVVICASPRTGKTLLADAYLLYVLNNDPADILISFHTKDVLRNYYDVRLERYLKYNNIITSDLDRFDNTQKLIKLPKSTIRLISVNTPNSLTALGARVVIADECWRYAPGIIAQIKNRTLDYRYSKKMLFISQGADEGSEFHIEFKQGQQAHWGFRCINCNVEQKYYVSFRKKDYKSYAGLIWDTNEITKPNNERNIDETLKTVRYECINCGHKYYDTEADRRLLNNNGLYIIDNPSANIDYRSYTWNAFACSNISFNEIARSYIVAKHDRQMLKKEKFRNFYLQELATFWSDEIGLEKYSLKVGVSDDESDSQSTLRITTVDVQASANLFYYVICEFDKEKQTIRLITFGKTDSFEKIDKINKEFKVKDQNVIVDSGHETRRVYYECARHGHTDAKGKWYCWTASKGEDPKEGNYYNTLTKKSTFFSRPKLVDANYVNNNKKMFCPFITFSNRTAKDILKSLLDNNHPKYKLFISEEAANDIDFQKQLNSEHIEYRNGKSIWVINTDHTSNHYWDCMVLVVLAGGIVGLL